ncbi:MAG: hypothetical protein QM726_01575 [Chitinophagaceae bacterium]
MQILQQLKAEYSEIVACSAIAEGADSIFADAALALDIPLEIVLPFDEYENDFETAAAQETYLRLKAAATICSWLPFKARSNDAYYAGMEWVVERSAIVVAAWNGKANAGRGGTSDGVRKIQEEGLDWIHIDTKHLEVNWHIKNSKEKKS